MDRLDDSTCYTTREGEIAAKEGSFWLTLIHFFALSFI
jgi:hypothetical protein